MGIKEKKMYGYLLLHSQHPCILTIGGVYPLDWPTCIQVIKWYSMMSIFESTLNFKYFFLLDFSFLNRFITALICCVPWNERFLLKMSELTVLWPCISSLWKCTLFFMLFSLSHVEKSIQNAFESVQSMDCSEIKPH